MTEAERERAAIVEWLRRGSINLNSETCRDEGLHVALADSIERGAHLSQQSENE